MAKMERTRTPGIYKRGDRYVVRWRDAGGKQRWASARLYDDARTLKSAKEKQSRDGEAHVPTSDQPTLADYARQLFGCDPARAPGATPERGGCAGRQGAIRDATRADYRRDMDVCGFPLLGRKRPGAAVRLGRCHAEGRRFDSLQPLR